MDSFSFDENVNADTFLNLPSSTPRSRKQKGKCSRKGRNPKTCRQQLQCPHCTKSYVSKFHFDKHVLSHGGGEAHSNEDNNLELSNVSIPNVLAINTSQQQQQQHQFKKPDAPARKTVSRKPSFVCTYCSKGYVCRKAYQTHMRNHVIHDAAARFPNIQAVIQNVKDISIRALTKVANAPVAAATGGDWRQLVGEVIGLSDGEKWISFSTTLTEFLLEPTTAKKFMLPSAYLSSLTTGVECTLSDASKRDSLLNVLDISDCYEKDLLCQFLLELSLNFVAEIISFIFKTFREGSRILVRKKVTEIDEEDKQVIYYIGGSIIRGYLRIAYRYSSSKKWALMAQTLKMKLLCDAPSQETAASWTMAVDRGGLLYITSECQIFFVDLTKVVFSCEEKDGSINYDKVLEHVSNSNLSVMWDQMIYDSLPPDLSLSLMTNVVRSFCKTCGGGFAKRRLNFLRQKPVISMPTRHLVATRKGR